MMSDYFTIGGMLSGFAVLVAWMFITSRVTIIVRIFASAVAVILGISIWLNATTLMGYAVAAVPYGRMPVLGIFDDKEHGFIYVWVEEEAGPRAYQVIYSSGLAKKLLLGKERAEEEGGQMVLRGKSGSRGKPGKAGGNTTGSSDDSLESQDSLSLEIDVIPILPPKD